MEKSLFDESKIIKKVNEGIESSIYLYKDKNGNKVILKKLNDRIVFNKNAFSIETRKPIIIDEKIRKNKEEKLQIISKEPCMKDEIQLLDLVFDKDGKFIGYTSKPDTKVTLNNKYCVSKKKKINYLTQLKDKLEELNRNGIYVGDFINSNNFGVRDGKVMLYDVDSFYVKGLDFDYKNDMITDYLRNNDKIDNVDNYCFNFFTISFYKDILISYIYDYLGSEGLPFVFNNKENNQLLNDMIKKRNYTKKYFLDNRKKGF